MYPKGKGGKWIIQYMALQRKGKPIERKERLEHALSCMKCVNT